MAGKIGGGCMGEKTCVESGTLLQGTFKEGRVVVSKQKILDGYCSDSSSPGGNSY